MAAPFYNAIKGVTAGAAALAAFTPSAASTGFRSWANVPSGWIGMVRFEDTGNAWELCFCYWNGATLSRSATQVFDSSTGSQLNLTAAATAALVVDADEISPDFAASSIRKWIPVVGAAAPTADGLPAATLTGTAAAGALATTNWLTEQPRTQLTSATTPASSQAGQTTAQACALSSSTAGRGGWVFRAQFGASGLPAAPRFFAGMTSVTFIAVNADPSAARAAANAGFSKDSADGNLQLLVNDGTNSASTKTDTGIALAANGWYEAVLWAEPGALRVYALLIRRDTGAIWFGSTATDAPATGSFLFPQIVGGMNATGTAFVLHVGAVTVRTGA